MPQSRAKLSADKSGSRLKNYWATDAIFAQNSIHICIRVGVCLCILFNIALFVWSNNINVATVRAVLDVRNKEDDLGEIFEFNLGGTVKDMWTAKTYALSILLAIFSGGWPYIKLVSMLLSLMLPKSMLSFAKRDGMLRWLDILGKWSLLDTFFMVMMMVAFQFDLYIAKDVELNVYVRAEWGFYSFLLATMLSLILGHVMLYLHRQVSHEEKGMPALHEIHGTESEEGKAMMNHTFYARLVWAMPADEGGPMAALLPHASSSGCRAVRIKITALGKIAVVFLIVSCTLAVVLGTFTNTFNFEFKGLTGFLLGDDSQQTYSAVSIGTYLPSASRIPNDAGIRWLQSSYFLFLLAMPLLFLIFVLLLLLAPLSLHRAGQAIVITEVVNAWNALDVFVIALVACLLEIQQFATFIVGDSCDELNKILEEYFDGILDGDDKCFDVITTLKTDAWLLYFSAGFLAIAGVIVMQICQVAYTQRLALCVASSSMAGSLKHKDLVVSISESENSLGSTDISGFVQDKRNGSDDQISLDRKILSNTLYFMYICKMVTVEFLVV